MVSVLLALGVVSTPASGDQPVAVSCPAGQGVQAVNFVKKSVICVSLANLVPVLAFISVEEGPINGLNGPHIIITGANLHLRSGSQHTVDATNLGNLVIGYNEPRLGSDTSNREGSHNLIIGPQHQ